MDRKPGIHDLRCKKKFPPTQHIFPNITNIQHKNAILHKVLPLLLLLLLKNLVHQLLNGVIKR